MTIFGGMIYSICESSFKFPLKILCSLQFKWSFHQIDSSLRRSLPEVSSHVAQKESMCFCHVPTVWLPVETAEKMAALNVDYITWIITVLGGQLTVTVVLPSFLI